MFLDHGQFDNCCNMVALLHTVAIIKFVSYERRRVPPPTKKNKKKNKREGYSFDDDITTLKLKFWCSCWNKSALARWRWTKWIDYHGPKFLYRSCHAELQPGVTTANHMKLYWYHFVLRLWVAYFVSRPEIPYRDVKKLIISRSLNHTILFKFH